MIPSTLVLDNKFRLPPNMQHTSPVALANQIAENRDLHSMPKQFGVQASFNEKDIFIVRMYHLKSCDVAGKYFLTLCAFWELIDDRQSPAYKNLKFEYLIFPSGSFLPYMTNIKQLPYTVTKSFQIRQKF